MDGPTAGGSSYRTKKEWPSAIETSSQQVACQCNNCTKDPDRNGHNLCALSGPSQLVKDCWVKAREGASRQISKEEQGGTQPDSVIAEYLQPRLCVLVFCLLALVCFETGQQHSTIFFAEPCVFGWEVWDEDEDEHGEDNCDQSFDNEDPLPSIQWSTKIYQGIGEELLSLADFNTRLYITTHTTEACAHLTEREER